MAGCRWMSSKMIRVSSRLCGETSLSSLEDVAQDNLGKSRSRRQNRLVGCQSIIDDFIEYEGLFWLGNVFCIAGGASVPHTNSACVTCRRGCSISMLGARERRLVPDVRMKIAMGRREGRREGGTVKQISSRRSSLTQMQARRARSLPCCPPGSSQIHSTAQIPGRAPIQRHRHLNERR